MSQSSPDRSTKFGQSLIYHKEASYALGLLVDACRKFQSNSPHPLILHVTSHFLKTTAISTVEVHIRVLRAGKAYVNLAADLVQKGEIKITALLIFRSISGGMDHPFATLAPPSPFARRVPLRMHPAVAPLTSKFARGSFAKYVRWAEDAEIRERNRSLGRGETTDIGGGTLEWGAWVELRQPIEAVNPSMLPFFGDMMKNLPSLLPREQRPPNGWYPTMVFSLEFKAQIPDDPEMSKRTLGLYSRATFMNEGRHDAYVEIWTAPSNLGEGIIKEGWRDKQICLGVATQTALIVPVSVNQKKAAAANSRL